MENEENQRRALLLPCLSLQTQRVFILKVEIIRPVGRLRKQQTESETKHLEVMPQKGEWETDQALISQGNLAPFTQDLARALPPVRTEEPQSV